MTPNNSDLENYSLGKNVKDPQHSWIGMVRVDW